MINPTSDILRDIVLEIEVLVVVQMAGVIIAEVCIFNPFKRLCIMLVIICCNMKISEYGFRAIMYAIIAHIIPSTVVMETKTVPVYKVQTCWAWNGKVQAKDRDGNVKTVRYGIDWQKKFLVINPPMADEPTDGTNQTQVD